MLKAAATVGGNTLISRVLGLVRDVVIAWAFGASRDTDAFFVAFRLPNFLRRLFAEGAFSQAFVPILGEYKSQRSHDEVRQLAAHVAGTLGAVLLVVTALGILAAPVLVMIFAPGFLADEEKYTLTVQMVRITFPYILFVSLTAFAAGLLNTYGRFGVPAFTPVLLNLALIGAALWLAPLMEEPVTALAWGGPIAGFAQLAFQLPFLKRLGLSELGSLDRLVRRFKQNIRPPGQKDHASAYSGQTPDIPGQGSAEIGHLAERLQFLLAEVGESFLLKGILPGKEVAQQITALTRPDLEGLGGFRVFILQPAGKDRGGIGVVQILVIGDVGPVKGTGRNGAVGGRISGSLYWNRTLLQRHRRTGRN